MKLKNYLPKYGNIKTNPYWSGYSQFIGVEQLTPITITVNGNVLPINELYKFPDFELDKYQIDQLDFFDQASFTYVLSQIKTEGEVLILLEIILSEYKQEGGDPIKWINDLLSNVDAEPGQYLPHSYIMLKRNLIEWRKVYLEPINIIRDKEVPALDAGPSKEDQVRDILKSFFINSDADRFNSLIENIITKVEKEYYPTLLNERSKADLYKALMKIVRLNIANRKHLAFVISRSCNMNEGLLYDKISK